MIICFSSYELQRQVIVIRERSSAVITSTSNIIFSSQLRENTGPKLTGSKNFMSKTEKFKCINTLNLVRTNLIYAELMEEF
ncbi:hypothetical protein BpHYR1_033426 [Brachionus plicatilis]|uniref:Uncharacterized protein n=1 Tax=Brachionus plicatilis TaxID=10195 RepID=A0A3M7RLL8_BRAPC|nr:hypothetical protein BpHYR1_033426 [Brachionus plicatilis]